ncbi:MAG: serine/threonine protein kinase [Polyangiaceae bacterium]|nr:serine/threonine protein kinase [Polyangiaceae bacterium]
MSQPTHKGGHRGTSPGQPVTERRRLGAVRHRALMLAMQGDHRQAARLLLDHLQVRPEDFRTLDAESRRLLSVAATYLHKAGEAQEAAVLFESLGETARAAALDQGGPVSMTFAAEESPSLQTYTKLDAQGASAAVPVEEDTDEAPVSVLSKDLSAAIGSASLPDRELIAWAETQIREGRPVEAARKLADTGYPYEAGVCYLKAGEVAPALAQLTRVAPQDPNYRAAARTIVRVLGRLERCDARSAKFFVPFVARGPVDEREIGLFLRLASLLEANNFVGDALAALESIRRGYPTHAETLARLRRLRMAAVSPTCFASDGAIAEIAAAVAANQDAAVARGPADRATEPAASAAVRPNDTHNEPDSVLRMVRGATPDRVSIANTEHEVSPTLQTMPSAPDTSERPSTVRVSLVPATGESLEVRLEPGAIIAERFRLNALIGQGGMAMVFAATDLELEEEVALKVFSGQLITKEWLEEAVQRFRQELKLCRKLRHPNIIQVYDIGIHGGHRYFTMELLAGVSLDKMLGEPLEVERGVDYLRQACAGLYAAHQCGVVHRDVKPENIFITKHGLVKIMDFGIAKSSVQTGTTTLGTIAGTPEYMAPEQIDDFSAAGPAADQYSLGVVAYYMFTGCVPFKHDQMISLLMMHLRQTPTPPRELNPSLPEKLEQVILRMLAKRPEDRFESCRTAAHHLSEAIAG